MAYPYKRKRVNTDKYNYFQRLSVNWSQFGAPDGYTVADGYGPDIVIPFITQGLTFLNEGAATSNSVEYSFDGETVHGDLIPTKANAGLTFDNRSVSYIWFRLKAGSTGPVDVRIEAWASR